LSRWISIAAGVLAGLEHGFNWLTHFDCVFNGHQFLGHHLAFWAGPCISNQFVLGLATLLWVLLVQFGLEKVLYAFDQSTTTTGLERLVNAEACG
jgi:hypothetical protein